MVSLLAEAVVSEVRPRQTRVQDDGGDGQGVSGRVQDRGPLPLVVRRRLQQRRPRQMDPQRVPLSRHVDHGSGKTCIKPRFVNTTNPPSKKDFKPSKQNHAQCS